MVVGNDASPKTHKQTPCIVVTLHNQTTLATQVATMGQIASLLLMKATQAKRVRDMEFLLNDGEQKRHLCVQIAAL